MAPAVTFPVGVTPAGLAITADGRHVFVTNNNNYGIPGSDSVTVLDTCTGLPRATIAGAFEGAYTVTFGPGPAGPAGPTPQGRAYVTNSDSNTIIVIDTTLLIVVATLTGFNGPSGMVIIGTRGYVINYGWAGGSGSGTGQTVSVVDLISQTIFATITVGQAPAALVASRCGQWVYVVNYVDGNPGTGTLSIISTATLAVVATIPGFSGPYALALTPCERYLYITNFGSNSFSPYSSLVSIVDLATQLVVTTLQLGIQPAGIAMSPDGCYAYVTNYNTLYSDLEDTNAIPGTGTVSIIDVRQRKVVAPTLVVGRSPGAAVLSPDGTTLYVSCYADNTVVSLCVAGVADSGRA